MVLLKQLNKESRFKKERAIFSVVNVIGGRRVSRAGRWYADKKSQFNFIL